MRATLHLGKKGEPKLNKQVTPLQERMALMRNYNQQIQIERYHIYILIYGNNNPKDVSRLLESHKSTIYRELKHNLAIKD